MMGQIIIPIPVLGAIIGNATGLFMYGIAKNNLSKKEQLLIDNYNLNIQQINMQLDTQYLALVEYLTKEFAKFKSILELALSTEVNMAFAGSIALAQYVGCDNEKIIKNTQERDNYFLN